MADFKCPEMAAVDGSWRFGGSRYIRIGGGGVGRAIVGRKPSTLAGHRLGIACALLLTAASLLLSAICMWNQRQLEAENSALKERFDALETKLLNVEEKLSQSVAFGRGVASSEAGEQVSSHRKRPKRSNGGEHRKRKSSKVTAAHYRLDARGGSTTTDLVWKLWNGPEATSERSRPTSQFSLEAARLSEDRKSVLVTESGLYFIYAQIHFENAKPRNAFAVKADDETITKCVQSLDYFNQSLNVTENARLKPCYSAATVVLRRNQVISLTNLYPSNRIFNDPYANYWGIVKFADV